ncbi:hypothetical protein EV356DRAFT_88413 [Viridothelium virens]|uniref:Uncharacterized protein n=1 Tax=Viridothelium virens TaxID=1048519 RepID=A0A6A6HCN4_VIRVR|nr:hypothetical protein EV356DRAFT_88413 [Viridothelium virens]
MVYSIAVAVVLVYDLRNASRKSDGRLSNLLPSCHRCHLPRTALEFTCLAVGLGFAPFKVTTRSSLSQGYHGVRIGSMESEAWFVTVCFRVSSRIAELPSVEDVRRNEWFWNSRNIRFTPFTNLNSLCIILQSLTLCNCPFERQALKNDAADPTCTQVPDTYYHGGANSTHILICCHFRHRRISRDLTIRDYGTVRKAYRSCTMAHSSCSTFSVAHA